MKVVDIIAMNDDGQMAILRLETNGKWIPMEKSDTCKKFEPACLHEVCVYNTKRPKYWLRGRREILVTLSR